MGAGGRGSTGSKVSQMEQGCHGVQGVPQGAGTPTRVSLSWQMERRSVFSDRSSVAPYSDEEEDGYDSPRVKRRGASVDDFLKESELGKQVSILNLLLFQDVVVSGTGNWKHEDGTEYFFFFFFYSHIANGAGVVLLLPVRACCGKGQLGRAPVCQKGTNNPMAGNNPGLAVVPRHGKMLPEEFPQLHSF